MSATNDIAIIHNPSCNRFEAHVDGALGRLEYRLDDGVLQIHHTEVPPSMGGRGIAGKLVEAALAHARANALRVMPSCSYARTWMRRHPQSLDLLPPGTSLG